MDPDAALKEARELVDDALVSGQGGTVELLELAERFRALDQWISSGGFLPAAWRKEDG